MTWRRITVLVQPEHQSREDWTGYVYTDRPVYRPGHTVQFKVILRTRSGERYTVADGAIVQIVIEDPTSKQLLQPTSRSPRSARCTGS